MSKTIFGCFLVSNFYFIFNFQVTITFKEMRDRFKFGQRITSRAQVSSQLNFLSFLRQLAISNDVWEN